MSVVSVHPSGIGAGKGFGPSEALSLGILGAVATAPIALDGIVASVQAIGGCGWAPNDEAIYEAIERLAAKGYIKDDPNAGPAAAALTITETGRTEVARLLRAEIRTADSTCHSLVLIKVAFLDLLDPPARWRQIGKMVDHLDRILDDIQASIDATPIRSACYQMAARHELRQIESERTWLVALANTLTEKPAA